MTAAPAKGLRDRRRGATKSRDADSRKPPRSAPISPAAPSTGSTKQALAGTQTLARGLDIIDAVARGACTLNDLARSVGLTRSTTHRLAGTLIERRYLKFARNDGYELGPKLLELGHKTSGSIELRTVAREFLEALSASTGDTVHLGILDGERALYLDKIQGTRRVQISSRIGDRQPLRSTGLGKALILDASESEWRDYYDHDARLGSSYNVSLQEWLKRMRDYSTHGYAFDLEENEDRIRCVAAPIRGVDGSIVGAISVSSAAHYMDDRRMRGLSLEVKQVADDISGALGFSAADAAQSGTKARNRP